jgi:hypothetical protein
VDEHMHVITAWTEFGGLGSSWVDPATHRRSYCGAVSVTSRLTWFAVPVALFLRCSLSRRQFARRGTDSPKCRPGILPDPPRGPRVPASPR